MCVSGWRILVLLIKHPRAVNPSHSDRAEKHLFGASARSASLVPHVFKMQGEGNRAAEPSVLMDLFGGDGPCTSTSLHSRYVPTHFSSLLLNQMRLSHRRRHLHLRSRWADYNFPPETPTLAAVEGSAVNFAAFFPQHGAILVPKTNGERRATSDGTASSSNHTRSQSPPSRHARIENQPRLEAIRQRYSLFRCAQHPPTPFAGDFAASTHWHDLSLCRDARRDVARCCWRRPPYRQHT